MGGASTERTGFGCGAGLVVSIALLAAVIVLFILGTRDGTRPPYLVLALACLIGAVAVPIAVLVRQSKSDVAAMATVAATGRRVEATIVDVRHGASGRPAGYRILAQGRNPVTGEQQTFIGPSIDRDPAWHLRERKAVTIAVDPNDPSRGVMDLSFIPGDKPVGWTLCTSDVPKSWQ